MLCQHWYNAQVMFRKSYGIVESLTMMIGVRLLNYTAIQGWANSLAFLILSVNFRLNCRSYTMEPP